MTRLQEKYKSEICKNLREKFGYTNVHQIPRLAKVVLNMGVGEAVNNAKAIDAAVQDLTMIAGQKPVIRKARKSIANFKLREGMPIGASVTLRRAKMLEFTDRLVNIVLPRVRDFRGIPKTSFDGRGNYSLGLAEQIVFPEIDLDKTQLRGLNITFVTTANNDEEGRELLKNFGFPFRR